MTDDCLFKKIIKELIHEETCQIVDELKPVIRQMIVEEFDRRDKELSDECIFGINHIPPNSVGVNLPREAVLEDLPVPVPKDSSKLPQYSSDESEGLYIYGIIDLPVDISLGEVGIDNAMTYTIPYSDLSAIVHNCLKKPYLSEDTDTVNKWVACHQNVLDIAAERFGMVLPFGFDTIISSTDTKTAREVFQNWIIEEYDGLRNKLNKIHGKKEYGVQVFYSPSVMSKTILAGSDTIRSLKNEMETKGPGLAYMYRKKIEQAVETDMSAMIETEFSNIFNQISELSDDTRVEKVKRTKEKDKVMMMNISCLVTDENYPKLGDLLEKIDNVKEYYVRFTGPWPPYSFV